MNIGDLFLPFSLSILPAAIIAIFKAIKIDNKNKPVVVYLILALMVELLSIYFIKSKFSPYYSIYKRNIYILLEFLILFTQLQNWGVILKPKTFKIFIPITILLWVITCYYSFITPYRNIEFTLFYSFIITISSISVVNKLLINGKASWQDYRFLFAIGFILYYTVTIFIETFCIVAFKDPNTLEMVNNIQSVRMFINVFCNILFLFAILCIPKKSTYLLQ